MTKTNTARSKYAPTSIGFDAKLWFTADKLRDIIVAAAYLSLAFAKK